MSKTETTIRRKKRVRTNLKKYANRPRLTVHISNLHIYAQIIDDQTALTIATASTQQAKLKLANQANAKVIGKKIAEAALAKNVKKV